MENNLYKRLLRVEAAAAAQRAEDPELLRRAYEAACRAGEPEDAAFFARQLRNKLLDISDKEMTLDRLKLDTSTAAKFMVSLAGIFAGAWAGYRQALRDLPQQEGFPFDVRFPEKPEES